MGTHMNTTSQYTALVTGASKGIGLGLVDTLLAQNYQVIATHRTQTAPNELNALQQANPQSLTLLPLDVTNVEDIANLKIHLKDTPIDFLINNAGVFAGMYQSSDDVNADEYLTVMNTNAVYPMLLTMQLMDNILLSHKKTVIAISSIFSSIGYLANIKKISDPSHVFSINDQSDSFYQHIFAESSPMLPYAFSKAAMNMMLTNLSQWFHNQHLKTLLIHPGNVDTDMTKDLPDKQFRITVDKSASNIVAIINQIDQYHTGSLVDHSGAVIDDLCNVKP